MKQKKLKTKVTTKLMLLSLTVFMACAGNSGNNTGSNGSDNSDGSYSNADEATQTGTGAGDGDNSGAETGTESGDSGTGTHNGPEAVLLTAETAQLAAGTVRLAWVDPADADFSHVLISVTPDVAGVTAPVRVDRGVQLALITGLTPGGSYDFSAVSVDTSDNQSLAGASVSITATLGEVALFNTGPRPGDFGFDLCQRILDDSSRSFSTQLQGRGYSKAVFFGSTPDYALTHAGTDLDALGLSGQSDVDLENRSVVVYHDSASIIRNDLFAGSKYTIGNLLNTDSAGAWGAAGNAILASLGISSTNRFWTFSDANGYSATRHCSGATSTADKGWVGNVTTPVFGLDFCSARVSNRVLCLVR